ncbi:MULTISPECIES: putative bifunctional diguanylate cyclase/phosphodiesterase [Halomonadaceae]|uniref:putative bifunctional diguanylate cyclase/phosphodiesterase n=1 Tax=Halomonadaceae TaxID=28256 RepID=UPI00158215EF|nr:MULTISPECIES: GGDEF domain-containing phosphodiesterase [Halomonas]MDI4639029.1 EAL domain-containing protein [Halomonas sp. BMC7]NUJ60019.1 EAL domain-containing protein [Halomonas taeanensis]
MSQSILPRQMIRPASIHKQWLKLSATAQHTLRLTALAVLVAVGWLIVYFTGGTAYAYPYLMLIPVILAAAWYQLAGALLSACLVGLLMALMPLNVATGELQPATNWLVRLGLYLLLGGVAGGLFERLHAVKRHSLQASYIDSRSGLPNYLALEEDLSKELEDSAGEPLGLMVVRITDIVDLLETLGADASDELVSAIGQRLDLVLNAQARIYRFNGPELMLLLTNVGHEALEKVAQDVLSAGEENLVIQQMPMRAQLILGYTLSVPDTQDARQLIHEARVAMFEASNQQRSYSAYVPAYRKRTMQAIWLISRVRQGLENNQFELHFQPKISLADNSVCGCEGLIRWRQEDGQLIYPGHFMPKVEKTTLITPVTRFVTEQALTMATQVPGGVSINVSARNLLDNDLIEMLRVLINQEAAPASRLEVEITESALMADIKDGSRAIRAIRDLGVGVSIDDFGTGFSSFQYLRHLPLSGLKLDRVFVMDLENDVHARKLLGCMIDMGHALGLVVTAEGVETRGQHDILVQLGCDQAQGFLYSPALAIGDYESWCGDFMHSQRWALSSAVESGRTL